MLTEYYNFNWITAIKVKVMIECWHLKLSESFLGFLNCLLFVVRNPGHLLQNVEISRQKFCQKCDNFNQRYVVKFSFFYFFRPKSNKNAFEDNGGWFLAKAPISHHSWLVRQLFNFEVRMWQWECDNHIIFRFSEQGNFTEEAQAGLTGMGGGFDPRWPDGKLTFGQFGGGQNLSRAHCH